MLSGVLLLSITAIASAARPAAPQGPKATARPRSRSAQVSRGRLVIPKGTKVTVSFDQALNSKTTKVGQRVRLHVADDVLVGGQKVIAKGASVNGVINKVSKRKRFGRNAEMRIVLRPVESVVAGKKVPLEAGGKGEEVSGRKSAQAAGASAGGAAVLGPVGLVGGYFVTGKAVDIKVGDTLVTEVPKDVVLRRR
jgi:hypothetical protein